MPRSPCGRSSTHSIGHDEVTRAVRASAADLDAVAVGGAFIAALRSRRFAHWSSLASFAFASTLPEHDFTELSGLRRCGVCGAYERVDAFASDDFATSRERGIVRTDSPRYAAYDLECFAREDRAEPTALDRDFFGAALARIAAVPPHSRTFAAERALGVIFASRIERKLFLGTLGVCGVMATPARPGFWPQFVPYRDRAFADASPYAYPVAWWRSGFGLDRAALSAFGLIAS